MLAWAWPDDTGQIRTAQTITDYGRTSSIHASVGSAADQTKDGLIRTHAVHGIAIAALLLWASPVSADITWFWSFATEFGTFVTDGSHEGPGDPPAGTYTIVDFTVTDSIDPRNLGSLAGGLFFETQPTQGFVWDGAIDTQWFRSSGTFTNGSNFFTADQLRRYVFFPGTYRLDHPVTFEEFASSTVLSLPEVSSSISGLAALLALGLCRGLARRQ